MRLEQYINEKIETKEFRDMVKNAIEDIYQQSKTIDNRNDLSKLIKNKLKPVFEDVVLNIIGDKDSSIRVSIKQQDEGIYARCTYDQMKNYFELEIYIGKDLLSTALYKVS